MNPKLTRREFSRSVAAAAAYACLPSAVSRVASALQAPELEVTDTHTHFYDPSRPQGVPWPDKDDKVLYRTVLPKDYRKLPVRYPPAGTVVVEASPRFDDNQWLLDLAEKNPFIVGFVGNVPAGDERFQARIKRLAENPRFRGVRLTGKQVREQIERKEFIADLHALRDLDLELDLNGGPEMLPDAARVAEGVKDLRIVINHVANLKIDGKAPPDEWRRGIGAAAKFEHVFCKVSGLVEGSGKRDGSAPADAQFYRPVLDAIWSAFGEGRLIYGSNWPVSERFAPLATVESIVFDYFKGHGDDAVRKVFASNAAAAYKHIPYQW